MENPLMDLLQKKEDVPSGVQELKKVIDKPELPLSACIITHKPDEKYINDCLSKLPKGIQIIITQTIPSDRDEMKEMKVYEENGAHIKIYEFHYLQPEGPINKMNFANARNACLSKADRDWIIILDTDDRLMYSPEMMNDMYKLPEEIGGVYITVISAHKPTGPNQYGHREASPQVRLIRNHRGFKFNRRVHEQIKPSILEAGYLIADSPMVINHIGYFGCTKEEIKAKYLRNIGLLCQDIAEGPDSYNMTMLINHCHELKEKGMV